MVLVKVPKKFFLFVTRVNFPVGNGVSREWRVFRAVHGGKPQFVAFASSRFRGLPKFAGSFFSECLSRQSLH